MSTAITSLYQQRLAGYVTALDHGQPNRVLIWSPPMWRWLRRGDLARASVVLGSPSGKSADIITQGAAPPCQF
ncbi:MAG: hypothetical protein V1772_05775 [Chloroflexota bacterium]